MPGSILSYWGPIFFQVSPLLGGYPARSRGISHSLLRGPSWARRGGRLQCISPGPTKSDWGPVSVQVRWYLSYSPTRARRIPKSLSCMPRQTMWSGRSCCIMQGTMFVVQLNLVLCSNQIGGQGLVISLSATFDKVLSCAHTRFRTRGKSTAKLELIEFCAPARLWLPVTLRKQYSQ